MGGMAVPTSAAAEREACAARLHAVAGFVAHDFNNLLAVIRGSAECLLADLPPGHASRADVLGIASAVEQGQGLTRQLLMFTHQHVMQQRTWNLDQVIANIEPLLSRSIRGNQHLELELDAGDTMVRADRAEVELALLTLVTNARDAMPVGGHVRIASAVVHHGADDATATMPPPGTYVRISVEDTGEGFSDQALAHQFEPFFTTKPVGEGTGIGLATVSSVMQSCRGFVTIESRAGAGAAVTLWFPPAGAAADVGADATTDITATVGAAGADGQLATAGSSRSSGPMRALSSGTKLTVLVVDDDDAVRAVTERLLHRMGHRVVAVESGAAALELLADPAHRVGLILTDYLMPGMTGIELLKQAQARGVHCHSLVMSGFTDDPETLAELEGAGIPFLAKPFSKAELASVIGTLVPP